ncbi:hypothetical protein EB796_018088 [Bugula neritina]|uniref:Uncharacterized protein n=1 Tax=Bugula neritina TaxID=10212 RepID=A0A7J7JD78_BUGNE|nr:hypothetical protein EB796_018088 [Bugula neritina]
MMARLRVSHTLCITSNSPKPVIRNGARAGRRGLADGREVVSASRQYPVNGELGSLAFSYDKIADENKHSSPIP